MKQVFILSNSKENRISRKQSLLKQSTPNSQQNFKIAPVLTKHFKSQDRFKHQGLLPSLYSETSKMFLISEGVKWKWNRQTAVQQSTEGHEEPL